MRVAQNKSWDWLAKSEEKMGFPVLASTTSFGVLCIFRLVAIFSV